MEENEKYQLILIRESLGIAEKEGIPVWKVVLWKMVVYTKFGMGHSTSRSCLGALQQSR